MSEYGEIVKDKCEDTVGNHPRNFWQGWRRYPEPVQFIFVLMFSICIVPRDKIFIDKVV